MANKKTAIVYARVSSLKQAEEGLPIDSQLEQCQIKAESLGAVILRVFKDEGISGRTSRRPAFQDAINYCAAYPIDYFIVWNTSRFARNKIDAGNYKKLLLQGNTKVVYVAAEIDNTTDEGWFSESIFEIVDELYSRGVSKDTKRSMMKNARDGFFNGGRIPFGYKTAPDGKRKRLEIDETESVVVRSMFSQYLQGAGCKEIAMRLNQAGQIKRNTKWNKNTVGLLLKNPVYAGYVTFNRKSHAEGLTRPEADWIKTKSHTGIVTEAEFLEVQRVMKHRAPREQGTSPHSRFVFSGLLKCGSCGSSMQTESATGRNATYRYYNCRSALKGSGCQNRRIPAAEFDDWMLAQIVEKILTPDRITDIIGQIYELRGEWYLDRESRRERLVETIRDAERRRNNLYSTLELHGKDAPNLGDLTIRLRDLKKRIDDAEKELTKLENEGIPEIEISHDQIIEATTFLRELIVRCDNPIKLRGLLSGIIDRIVLNDGDVKVEYVQERLIKKMNQGGGLLVHSENYWLPERGLLRTAILSFSLPKRFAKAA